MLVDLDAAAIVERDAGLLQAEAFGVGHAANANQNHVGLEGFRSTTGGGLDIGL